MKFFLLLPRSAWTLPFFFLLYNSLRGLHGSRRYLCFYLPPPKYVLNYYVTGLVPLQFNLWVTYSFLCLLKRNTFNCSINFSVDFKTFLRYSWVVLFAYLIDTTDLLEKKIQFGKNAIFQWTFYAAVLFIFRGVNLEFCETYKRWPDFVMTILLFVIVS